MDKKRESPKDNLSPHVAKNAMKEEKDFKFFEYLMRHDAHKKVGKRIRQTKWEK